MIPSGAERLAGQARPAEGGEQGDPGHGRRQHHRQVDERLQHALAAELRGGEQVGDGQPERDDDHRRGEAGDEAQPERLQDERVPQPGDEVARGNPEHEAQQREAEQEDQQRAQHHRERRGARRRRADVRRGATAGKPVRAA